MRCLGYYFYKKGTPGVECRIENQMDHCPKTARGSAYSVGKFCEFDGKGVEGVAKGL